MSDLTHDVNKLLRDVHMRRRRLPAHAERRRIRVSAGVSLRDMADAIGVSHASVGNWERSSNPKRSDHLTAYVDLLDSLSEILDAYPTDHLTTSDRFGKMTGTHVPAATLGRRL